MYIATTVPYATEVTPTATNITAATNGIPQQTPKGIL